MFIALNITIVSNLGQIVQTCLIVLQLIVLHEILYMQ